MSLLRSTRSVAPVLTEALEGRRMFVAADPAFGSGGVLTRFNAQNNEFAEHAVTLTGGVLVEGRTYDGDHSLLTPGTTVFALYTLKGKLAPQFNGNGKLVLSDDLNAKIGIVHDVLRRSNNSVLVVGDHGVAVLEANGKFDAAFGNQGVAAVPQYAEDQYDDSWDAVTLSNGDIKHGSYSPSTGVLAVATFDYHGTLLRAIRRTIGAGGGPVYVTPNAETVAYTNGKIRQFRSSLQIESNFGVGGIDDITAAYASFANNGKPWNDIDDDPVSGIPPFEINTSLHLEPTRRGFMVYGAIEGENGQFPFSHDHGQYETAVSIDIGSDGKSARFYPENAPAVVYGHTYFTVTASGSFNFQHFGGTFFRTNGTSTKYEDQKFENVNDEYAIGAIPAGGGKYYVFGTINQYGPNTNDLYHFVVVRTNPVD